jgi:isopentenyldiphosphate isomerase
MELLYHVDEDDNVLGSVERSSSEMVLHRSGMIFLERSDSRILITHRSPAKRVFPDLYDSSAAFHVTYGETYEQAAERELGEETGVHAPLAFIGKFKHCDPPENQIVAVFVAKSDDEVHLNAESTGGAFRTKDEIDSIVAAGRVTPWLRDGWKLAREAL